MGVFVSRILKEFEDIQKLETKAQAVTKIPAPASWDANGVESIVAKAKSGKLSSEGLTDIEKSSLNDLTQHMLQSAKGADGKYSGVALRNLQRAYTHSVLVEFGEGASAEAAAKVFRQSISDVWKEARRSEPGKSAKGVEVVERLGAKDAKNVDVRIRATEVRATEKAEARSATANSSSSAPNMRTGPQSNQTEAELAATARSAADRANFITDAVFGSRTDIAKGLRSFEQGSFSEKKAAFDLIDKNMQGSGYIAAPQNAAEAAQMAKQQVTRSVEETKNLLLTRPGMAADGTFINGIINQAEWGKLRSALRSDLLGVEQKEIISRIDQVRIAGGAMPDSASTFTRLRDIMRDPDYVATHALKDEVKAAQDEVKAAQDSVVARKPEEIEADLRSGKAIADSEVTILSVKYGRTDKDIINAFSMKAMSKDSRTFLSREDTDAFRSQLLKNNQLDLAGARDKSITKDNLAEHLNQGRKISAADFDDLVNTAQREKRPVKLNIPGGSRLGLEGVEVPKWLRNTVVGSMLGYFGLVNVPGAGDSVDGGLVGAAYKGVVAWQGGKITAIAEKDVSIAKAEQRAADKNRVEQDLAAGAREFARDVTSLGRQGASVGEVTDVIAKQYESGTITTDQMEKLANQMAKISSQDGKEVMSRTEFETVMKDPAMTTLPPAVQTAVSNELKLKLP